MPPLKRFLPVVAVLAVLLASHACAGKAGPRSGTLAELVASHDRDITPYYPFIASDLGLRRYDRVFANDIGEDHRNGMRALCARYREALRTVDAASLNEQERLTYDLLQHQLETCLARLSFPWHLLPVNQVGQSWPSRFPVVGAGRANHPFKTARNYEDFLGRIDGFVIWMDTAIANMRVGIERDFTQPRDAMVKLLPQLDAQIVEDPRASPFYEPVRNFPAQFDDETRRILESRYVEAIQGKIVPAYQRLRAFVQDEYLPRCRTSSGWSDLPGGRAMYAHAVRISTTTDRTPAEIYDLGVAEVARIRAQIDQLRREIEAAGDPELTRYGSVDDLVRGYAELRVSVEAALPKLFGRFPRAGFEVRPIEAFRERTLPSSYEASSPDGSRPGVFYLNAAAVRAGGRVPVYRNLFIHEAVPGHHFQIALQRENRELPGFRRFGWYTAFGEGWALYAEALGAELGVYGNRRDRLNALFAELFRAHRLVVDVGLHDKGWTREQAIRYLGGPSPNNVLEVERFMVWPGQALAYKIGQLKILDLRRRAEAALGPVFDVRAFHDEVLRDGAMPLTILEAKMDRWIAAQQGRRP